MPGVHRLQHVERLAAAALSHDDPIGPHAQRIADQLPDCHQSLPLQIAGSGLECHQIRMIQLQLCRVLDGDNALAAGTWEPPLRDLLARAVRARLSILVSGGTGSGKTTTLNALSSFVSAGERIVTVEDTLELRLRQPHVVRLEARPASVEGRGEVTIRHLVRNALRMRPDRLVVGEVRGGEALDMLQAMTTGHDGSLTTVHAKSPGDALRRIELLALMAGLDLPHAAVREQVASAFDVVVQVVRRADGERRLGSISGVERHGRGWQLAPRAAVERRCAEGAPA